MRVQDVMARIVHTCRPHTNLAEAAKLMWDNDCGALPVVDHEGKVLGMITDRDICMAVATRDRTASFITVWETITGQIHACAPTDDVRAALKTMATEKVRRLPVVDEKGVLQGLLTMNDLVLRAEERKGKKPPELSYEDVMSTLKMIGEHRVLVCT